MEQIELKTTNRKILGKKVRFLRRQGVIPAHLFGHGIESLALQCEAVQLQRVLSQAGKTRLVSLKLSRAKKPRNVVVREIQRNPLTGELLHVDFYQVRMAEKIKVEVPILLVGEAPALRTKGNMLLQELNSLTVECLPDRIPTSIALELSFLTEADQAIQVKDIVLGEGITLLNHPEQIIVKVMSRPIEKVEEVAAMEEAAKAPEVAPLPEEESKEE